MPMCTNITAPITAMLWCGVRRERAKHQGRSLKDVLNSTLRAGLGGENDPRPFRQDTASLGLRAGIDIDRAGRVSDQLEDAERVREL